MKIDLCDGYLIDEKEKSVMLKKRYIGSRNGAKVECEKIVSHHSSFEDASKRFLELIEPNESNDTLISLNDYLKSLNEAKSKADETVAFSQAERFYIYTSEVNEPANEDVSIANFIPSGSANAITRKMLISKCVDSGLIDKSIVFKDRMARRLIQKERLNCVILNLSDGNGYYRPTHDDLLDLQRFIRQEENRAKEIFRNISLAKKLCEDYKSGRL